MNKSPLGAAIAARRKPQEMPAMEAPSESAMPMEGGESKIAELLAAMSEDDKLQLFEALKSEMEAPAESEGTAELESESPGMTDEKGQLKPTQGEQAALAEDQGPVNPNENSFLRHARRNVANLSKQGKL